VGKRAPCTEIIDSKIDSREEKRKRSRIKDFLTKYSEAALANFNHVGDLDVRPFDIYRLKEFQMTLSFALQAIVQISSDNRKQK